MASWDNRIVAWALSNTKSLKHSHPSLQLAHMVLQGEGYGIPPDAKQKTGPTPLGTLLRQPKELVATDDFRMQQVVFADGKLWSAITTSVKQGPNCVNGFQPIARRESPGSSSNPTSETRNCARRLPGKAT